MSSATPLSVQQQANIPDHGDVPVLHRPVEGLTARLDGDVGLGVDIGVADGMLLVDINDLLLSRHGWGQDERRSGGSSRDAKATHHGKAEAFILTDHALSPCCQGVDIELLARTQAESTDPVDTKPFPATVGFGSWCARALSAPMF